MILAALETEKRDELVDATRPKRNTMEFEKQYIYIYMCVCVCVCNINMYISIEEHLEWTFGDNTVVNGVFRYTNHVHYTLVWI
jgi:hypothetical protein